MNPRRLAQIGSVVAAILMGIGLARLVQPHPDADRVYETALNALELGRFDEAEAGMARLARLRAPTVLDRGVQARIEIARGREAKAMSLLASIPDDHVLASWARMRVGQLYRQTQQYRAAEKSLREALALDPSLVAARRELIYILALQLRRQELCCEFELLAEQSMLIPKEVWVWSMVRDLVWWSPFEQTPLLQKAIDADPNDRWSRLALAEVERKQGRYREASLLLEELPQKDPDAIAARAGLAMERQSVEQAEALLRQGPEGHPGLNGLRGRIAIIHRDGPAAVKYLERANLAEPGRRQTISDLGRAWLVAGDDSQSETYVQLATKIDELSNLLMKAEFRVDKPDPEICRKLGYACEAASRHVEARSWLQLVLMADPSDVEIQRSLFRLKSRLEEKKSQNVPSSAS